MTSPYCRIAAALISAVLATACVMPIDENINVNDNGELDTTSYAGLQILGERSENGDAAPIGPLDLVEIQVALYTLCFDQLVTEGEDVLKGYCHEPLEQKGCEIHTCSNLVFNCLGYKNLELAESTGVFEFDTQMFSYRDPVIIDGDARFNLLPGRQGSDTGPSTFGFRIPPLSAAQKTLAYMAARAAFSRAGLHAAFMVERDADPGYSWQCYHELIRLSPGSEDELTLLSYFTHGIAESMSMFNESNRLTTVNQLNVAASYVSKTTNYSKAQDDLWQGEANSQSSALRGVVGNRTELSLLQGCNTELQDKPQRVAVEYLRAAGLDDTFNLDDITDNALVIQVQQVLADDVGSTVDTSPEDFLWRRGITLDDIGVARRYMRDERDALGRMNEPDDTADPDGPARVHGMSKGALQHPPAYHLGKAVATGSSAQFPSIIEYAQTGAVQAMDAFRKAVNTLLKKSLKDASMGEETLTEDQREMLSKASLLGSEVAGRRRMEIEFTRRSAEDPVRQVRIQGAKSTDTYFVVKGEAGYRCVIEGSIDGKPCNLGDHLVAPDYTEYTPAPDDNPVKGPLDDTYTIWLSNAQINNDDQLHVFSGSDEGARRYQGTFQVQEEVHVRIPVISGSGFDDLVRSITKRESGQCGVPADPCGNFGIPRDFVPPLENELTEDSDAYEDNWRHYLNLAQQAAEEADRLGEQLVQSGLDMDLRSEAARQQLEQICGGVVNLPDLEAEECTTLDDENCDAISRYLVDDPGMQSCLPTTMGGGLERGPVSLGVPMCIYKWGKGRICTCPDLEDDPTAVCEKNCPMVAAQETSSPEGCKLQFNPDGDSDDWIISGETAGDVEFIYVDNALNVFETGSQRVEYAADCDGLIELEGYINDPTLSEWEFQNRLSAWRRENGNRWVNLHSLKLIAQSLKLDVDLLHHYTVSLSGQVLWTTKQQQVGDCPPPVPWLDETGHINCVAAPAPLYPVEPDWPHEAWLYREIQQEPLSGPAWVREAWGMGIMTLMTQLGALTGGVTNIRTSGYTNSVHSYADVSYLGEQSTGLLVRQMERDWAGGPLICLYKGNYSSPLIDLLESQDIEVDSEIAPCHEAGEDDSTKTYRFAHTTDFELESGDVALSNFWRDDLWRFLVGSYPTGDRWKLGSYYHKSLKVVGVSIDGYDNGRTRLLLEPGSELPGWSSDNNHFRAMHWRFSDVITRHSLVELLKFACYMRKKGAGIGGACPADGAATLPQINDIGDLDKVRDQVNCVADSINAQAAKIVIPGLPKILAEGYQRNGIEGYYPNYQGENLKILLALEGDLQKFGNTAAGIRDVLRRTAQHLEAVRLVVKEKGIQSKINSLQTAVNVLSTVLKAAQVASDPKSWLSVSAPALAIGYTAIAAMQAAIGGLQDEIYSIQEEQAYQNAMTQVGDRLFELRGLMSDIMTTHQSIQANLTTMDQQENRAAEAFANMAFLDKDTAGHVLHVNTVMRRRQNTQRVRYQNALVRAKKLAFIARRAIEFRLGVDMTQMHDGMTLVPPPAEWVDRVCEMQGFDYEKLRDAYPEDPLLDPELQESDSYAHWYIGDYVKLLGDFVESYNIDFPFTDERDTAVISIRDDITQVKEDCEVTSYNLLYHSGNVGTSTPVDVNDVTVMRGWSRGGCVEGDNCVASDPAYDHPFCDDAFCFTQTPESLADPAIWPAEAERLRDPAVETYTDPNDPQQTVYSTRAVSGENTGYFTQTVEGASAGEYFLTWFDHRPEDATAIPPSYRVEVWDMVAGTQPTPAAVYDASDLGWKPRKMHFVLGEITDVEIRIYPSHETSLVSDPSAVFGDVLIWGVQLEWIHPDRCVGLTSCADAAALSYQETEGSRQITQPLCVDYDGSEMRALFTPRCICLDRQNGVCPEGSEGATYRRCFYEYIFNLSLDDIDRGDLIPSNNIAVGNFNYRHEALAVNIVGTNVIDCTLPWSTATCYTNAFVPYTFEHMGEVNVRNHERTTQPFTMHLARIEHGKGLAAEVVVTNPITSSHSQLLGEYWKDGLRGRPLQGTYALRIWVTDDLDWDKIEDIQLVWKYRYWTQMGSSY